MKLRRSLYARPAIVRGEQCAGAPLGRRSGRAAGGVPEHNTVGRLSVRSLGVVAKRVRMPAVLSSPCPRSCPASGVQCPVRASGVPGVPVHVTGVRCGRPSVQVSSVRPRRPCVAASAVSDGNEVTGAWRWAGRRTAGMAGVGVVTRHVRNGASSARGWSLASKLAQAVLGQRRVTWSSWEVVSSRPSRPGELDACEVRPSGTAAGGDHATWSLCEAWAWVGWSRSASGLHCGLSLRPQRGRNLQ